MRRTAICRFEVMLLMTSFLRTLGQDLGARALRVEEVLDPDRDVQPGQRLEGPRVENLGPEIRELGRLAIGQPVDHRRPLDELRVGGHEAVDVLPDLELFRPEPAGDDRGAVVRAVPAEGCGLAVGRDAEETRDHGILPASPTPVAMGPNFLLKRRRSTVAFSRLWSVIRPASSLSSARDFPPRSATSSGEDQAESLSP